MRVLLAATALLVAGCDPGYSFKGGVGIADGLDTSTSQSLVVVIRSKDPADVERMVGDVMELQSGQEVYPFELGSIGLPDTAAWEVVSWLSRNSVIDWKERWLAHDLRNRQELVDAQPEANEPSVWMDLDLPPCQGFWAGAYCPNDMRVDVVIAPSP